MRIFSQIILRNGEKADQILWATVDAAADHYPHPAQKKTSAQSERAEEKSFTPAVEVKSKELPLSL